MFMLVGVGPGLQPEPELELEPEPELEEGRHSRAHIEGLKLRRAVAGDPVGGLDFDGLGPTHKLAGDGMPGTPNGVVGSQSAMSVASTWLGRAGLLGCMSMS